MLSEPLSKSTDFEQHHVSSEKALRGRGKKNLSKILKSIVRSLTLSLARSLACWLALSGGSQKSGGRQEVCSFALRLRNRRLLLTRLLRVLVVFSSFWL